MNDKRICCIFRDAYGNEENQIYTFENTINEAEMIKDLYVTFAAQHFVGDKNNLDDWYEYCDGLTWCYTEILN